MLNYWYNKHMGFTTFISWWYSAGWTNAFYAITGRVQLLAKELSMPILATTLFEPWKQISFSGGVNVSLDAKLRLMFDNVFSRIFGFIIRSTVLLIGVIASVIVFIGGVILALLWPIIPVLPLLCIVMAVITV